MPLLNALGLARRDHPLAVGAPAPQIVTVDQDGNRLDLGELFKNGLTYLFFFPRANTPGCTLQACDLRDSYARLQESGIRVVGVSRGKPEALRDFHAAKKLPYPLAADTDKKVLRAFGVPLIFGLPARQSYLIRNGVVVWRDLHARVRAQADDLLRALPNLPR